MEIAKHLVRNFKPSQAIIKTGQKETSPITNKVRILTIPEIISQFYNTSSKICT